VLAVWIELSTVANRFRSTIWKLDKLELYSVNVCVGCRDPFSNSVTNEIEVGHVWKHCIALNCVLPGIFFQFITKYKLVHQHGNVGYRLSQAMQPSPPPPFYLLLVETPTGSDLVQRHSFFSATDPLTYLPTDPSMSPFLWWRHSVVTCYWPH